MTAIYVAAFVLAVSLCTCLAVLYYAALGVRQFPNRTETIAAQIVAAALANALCWTIYSSLMQVLAHMNGSM